MLGLAFRQASQLALRSSASVAFASLSQSPLQFSSRAVDRRVSSLLPAGLLSSPSPLPGLLSSPTSSQLFPTHRMLYSSSSTEPTLESLNNEAAASSSATETTIIDAETVEEAKPVVEEVLGASSSFEFQAETRKLLDIVARSLYSEREVFVRELISNASDALEKLRHRKVVGEPVADATTEEEIHISTDEMENTLTIQDFGIGMSEEELIKNLGTIAHSGTGEFLKNLQNGDAPSSSSSDLIGQFGVGFYSAFMVADRVTVYTRSAKPDGRNLRWESDGTGSFKIAEVMSDLPQGTKVVMHLKNGASEFSKATTIQDIIKRYSSFVRFNIKLNGKVANSLQAIWTKKKSEITEAEHQEFYQFISHSYDKPLYHLHFSTDTPIQIQSIFYVPGQHAEKYGMGRMDPGVALYSRRVMIQAAARGLLPEWLRFIKGVVDSEDIPLNLSRELLQDSAIIQKLNTVLTRRILKHLSEMALAEPETYEKFFSEFGSFLKEGACSDTKWKEELGKLVRFESSATTDKKLTSFDDYISRMQPDQQEIYYLVVPSRAFAESSPYYEGFQKRGLEVLFLYTGIDDFMMGSLQSYSGKRLVTIESADPFSSEKDKEDKPQEQVHTEFTNWLQDVLDERVSQVKASTRLVSSPAVIVDHESAAFRRMMNFVDPNHSPRLPKQVLEYNPSHPIILQLEKTRDSNPELAELIAEQIFDDALIAAGLLEDARVMLPRLNSLMQAALEATNKTNSKPTTE